MAIYGRMARSARTFGMLTGMTAGEFDLLYAEVEKRYPRIRDDMLSKRERTRVAGAGRPAILSEK